MAGKRKCPDCGSENRLDAKFCTQCGSAFAQQDAKPILCSNCGEENPASAKFCSDCGQALRKRRRTKSSTHKSKPGRKDKKTAASKQSAQTIKIAAGIIAVVLLYLFMTDDQQQNRRQNIQPVSPVMEKKLSDPGLENKVMEIASKFICSCGGCGEDPLDECDCETARSERNFIRRLVADGQKAEDIIKAVNMKYGWIKPQYKDKYGAGKPVVDLKKEPFELPVSASATEQEINGQRLASLADRLTIISSFACPCGQCDIDELKDCECGHPRGAKEVKSFIDKNIATGKYSVENIVQLVETQYGNRIR